MALPRASDLQLRLVESLERGKKPGASACDGDSGGPVMEETSLGLVIVVGVVSWSSDANGRRGCGGITGVTPISTLRSWIVDNAKALGSPIDAY